MLNTKSKDETKVVKEYNKIWINYFKKEVYEYDIIRHRENRKTYHDIVCQYIQKAKKPNVIELGCGTCIDTNLIAKRNKTANYFALDMSKYSVQLADKISQTFDNHIYIILGNTMNLPIKDKSFDIIFSQGLVEHFPDPIIILKEQTRILKPNGFLIVNVPQKFTGYTLMKKKMMKEKKWKLGWEREFSYNDLKQIGKSLKLTEIEAAGYQYWKSWKEPTFVLRDLYDKFHRRNPLKNFQVFKILRKLYESFWKKLEDKWGHYFLQNIIIVFHKN